MHWQYLSRPSPKSAESGQRTRAHAKTAAGTRRGDQIGVSPGPTSQLRAADVHVADPRLAAAVTRDRGVARRVHSLGACGGNAQGWRGRQNKPRVMCAARTPSVAVPAPEQVSSGSLHAEGHRAASSAIKRVNPPMRSGLTSKSAPGGADCFNCAIRESLTTPYTWILTVPSRYVS